jgi:hypothetical protein
MFRRSLLSLLLPAALFATAPATAEDTAPRRSTLVVFGNDPCPRSSDDEIIVCARMPESERYRIPKRFRDKRPADAPAPDTWANRVTELETVSRIGTPDSCSVVGSGGQTGCYSKFLREAAEARRQQKAEQADVP